MSMIRKYRNQTLQTIPQHREEETQNTNSHKTGKRLKQTNELSLPRQNDYKTSGGTNTKYATKRFAPPEAILIL